MNRFVGLAVLALVSASPAVAQRSCATGPSRSNDGTALYPACSTDRAPRLVGITRAFRYPEILRAAGITVPTDPLVLATIDTMGRIVPSSVIVLPATIHPGFRTAMVTYLLGFRFTPAVRDGAPVPSTDSIWLRIDRSPWKPFVPRDCVDCDSELFAARRRALDALSASQKCIVAITTVMGWDIPDSSAWAFELAPTCPGATDAAEVAARLDAYHYSSGIGPERWAEFASRVRSRRTFEFALESARLGNIHAFMILAFQVTGTSARIADSTPSSWDERHHLPRHGCGPITVFAGPDSAGVVVMDATDAARTVALADSLVGAKGTAPEVRTAAWCLAAQLR